MEKKFLLYLLYAALIEIRERSYERKDNVSYWLCDLLHNIPLQLLSNEDTKDTYTYLLDNINELGVQKWFDNRKDEFENRFPEYKISN
jgi:hypothetical protein